MSSIKHKQALVFFSAGVGDAILLVPLVNEHKKEGYNTGNSRKGSFLKTVTTENVGDIVLNIPRDRNGEFEPQIIPKGQTISSKIEDAVLGMYSRGMTTADVRNQVLDVYGLEISETTVSNITGRVMESAKEWQQRALERRNPTSWGFSII